MDLAYCNRCHMYYPSYMKKYNLCEECETEIEIVQAERIAKLEKEIINLETKNKRLIELFAPKVDLTNIFSDIDFDAILEDD